MPAISGAATLVPPNTSQAELLELAGPKTATPVLGSATAETSATVRRAQPESVCQVGLAYTVRSGLAYLGQGRDLRGRAQTWGYGVSLSVGINVVERCRCSCLRE